MYGAHGVCEIINIEQKRIDRKNIEYYVLSPIRNASTCFYIPTQSEKALSKLNPLLSSDELLKILVEQANGEDPWIEDENARKQRTKEVISSGNNTDLIRWVRSMHIHRRALAERGKKFHQADEGFLKDAERLLTTEFSVIFKIPEDAVGQYVKQLFVNNR